MLNERNGFRWAGLARVQRVETFRAPFKEHAPTIVNPNGSASLRRRGRPSLTYLSRLVIEDGIAINCPAQRRCRRRAAAACPRAHANERNLDLP